MRNIKIGVSIVLFFLVAPALQAQSTFGATILAGFNAAQLDGDDFAGFNKVGVNVGIRGDVFLTDKLEIGMELVYSQRGSRSELGIGQNVGPQLKIDLDYVQVPIIVSYNDWLIEGEDYYRVNAFAGLSYGRLLRTKTESSAFDNNNDLFRKNDFGLHIGAAFMFNPKLGISIRFNRGLLRVFDNAEAPLISRSLVSRYLTFRFEYSL